MSARSRLGVLLVPLATFAAGAATCFRARR